jgi:pilus assembly protein Flp/PilA
MNKLILAANRFIQDEEGLTVMEYVIGAALLVAALTTMFTGYGAALLAKLTAILASF